MLELEEFSFVIQPGDRLVLFSDGVPDATNDAGAQYGYGRLTSILEENQSLTAQELVDAIVADVDRWSGTSPAFEDLTLLILESTDQNGSKQPIR